MATVDADRDYALALQIQDAIEPDKDKSENSVDKKLNQLQKITVPSPKGPIGIVDPYWELADPNPNIYELFMMFDSLFFDGILNNRGVSVQWSPRMTLLVLEIYVCSICMYTCTNACVCVCLHVYAFMYISMNVSVYYYMRVNVIYVHVYIMLLPYCVHIFSV